MAGQTGIVARRKFLEAAQKLAKSRDPDMEDITAVTQPLAQIIANLAGRDCELVLRFRKREQPVQIEEKKTIQPAHAPDAR